MTQHFHDLRMQAAVIRALLDEIDRRLTSPTSCELIAEQIVEELTRLGCRTLETASVLARSAAPPSGVRLRADDDGEPLRAPMQRVL